jgi:hypothetical protein
MMLNIIITNSNRVLPMTRRPKIVKIRVTPPRGQKYSRMTRLQKAGIMSDLEDVIYGKSMPLPNSSRGSPRTGPTMGVGFRVSIPTYQLYSVKTRQQKAEIRSYLEDRIDAEPEPPTTISIGNNPLSPSNEPVTGGNMLASTGNNPLGPGNEPVAPGNTPQGHGNGPVVDGNMPPSPGNTKTMDPKLAAYEKDAPRELAAMSMNDYPYEGYGREYHHGYARTGSFVWPVMQYSSQRIPSSPIKATLVNNANKEAIDPKLDQGKGDTLERVSRPAPLARDGPNTSREQKNSNDWLIYGIGGLLAAGYLGFKYFDHCAKETITKEKQRCEQCENDLFLEHQENKRLKAEKKKETAKQFKWFVNRTFLSENPSSRALVESVR